MKDVIHYKGGYKYQLVKKYKCKVCIHPIKTLNLKYIRLATTGTLTIRSGYAWDGPSGPTIDTKSFMRGSLIHDALYQLLRDSDLPQCYRKQADIELRKTCLEDGMFSLFAWIVYNMVRVFAGKAASKEMKRKVITAP